MYEQNLPVISRTKKEVATNMINLRRVLLDICLAMIQDFHEFLLSRTTFKILSYRLLIFVVFVAT